MERGQGGKGEWEAKQVSLFPFLPFSPVSGSVTVTRAVFLFCAAGHPGYPRAGGGSVAGEVIGP